MPLFYSRTENDKEIVIIWKGWVGLTYAVLALTFLVVFLTHMLFFDLSTYVWVLMIMIFLYICFFKVSTHRVKKEIFSTAQKGHIKMTGSRFSINNPMKVTILKNIGQS